MQPWQPIRSIAIEYYYYREKQAIFAKVGKQVGKGMHKKSQNKEALGLPIIIYKSKQGLLFEQISS